MRPAILRKAIAAAIAVTRKNTSRQLYASIGGGSPIRRLTEEQAAYLWLLFSADANLLATLEHRAIPRIYDYFTLAERSYLVLEYINGKDLEALLNEVLQSIFTQYLKLIQDEADDIRFRYLNSLYRRDGFHKYADANGEFMARIENVSKTGRLCLITDSGEQREYYFKEVSFV